jgi:hypothetical protein
MKTLWSYATLITIPWPQHYITEESAVTVLWKPQTLPVNRMSRIHFPRRTSTLLDTATSTVTVSPPQPQARSQWVLESSLAIMWQELEAHHQPTSKSGLCIGRLFISRLVKNQAEHVDRPALCMSWQEQGFVLFYFVNESAITVTCS